MKIAVDAMGGDNAPHVIVKGCVEALRDDSLEDEIILVGRRELITQELALHDGFHLPISIEDAREVITNTDHPATAVKSKRDSSIVISANLIKSGKAHALVSAGNTGAVMASALLELGRLRGILRPAIATVIPTTTGFSVLLDAGANVDCKPKHLLQFAIMGHVYAKKLLGKQNPKVGLLNIGEEKEKGNALTSRTFDLLASSSLNFVGNVEGRDIVNGRCDVVVCDGFVGNVVLKFGESLAEMILKELRSVLTKHLLLRFATLISNSPFKDLKRRVDYTEYGGAPLLGVNGVCIISHGNSTSKAIRNAIQVARKFVRRKVNESLERDIALSQQIKE